jgi:hypothetical protein
LSPEISNSKYLPYKLKIYTDSMLLHECNLSLFMQEKKQKLAFFMVIIPNQSYCRISFDI